MNYDSELERLIERYFPEIEASRREKILQFYQEVLKWNEGINLVSRKDPERTAVKLVLDSLFLLRVLKGKERVLDVGSGAGFPALPLLICLDIELVMVESRKKKAAFLNHVIRLLDLKKVRVIRDTVTDGSVQKLDKFDTFWAKAALPLEMLFSLGRECLFPGGRLILFRPFLEKRERKLLEDMLETHGFSPPVYGVYSCPELYLTRTLTICQKIDD